MRLGGRVNGRAGQHGQAGHQRDPAGRLLWRRAPGGMLPERSAQAGIPTPTSPNPMKIPRSHFLPRTRAGWIAATAFCLTMALAQPPIVHGLMNRIEPWILGMPFLFAYLLGVYCLVIAVLVWAARKGL